MGGRIFMMVVIMLIAVKQGYSDIRNSNEDKSNFIFGNNVELRSEPDLKSNTIKRLAVATDIGQPINLHMRESGDPSRWYKVKLDESIGFVTKEDIAEYVIEADYNNDGVEDLLLFKGQYKRADTNRGMALDDVKLKIIKEGKLVKEIDLFGQLKIKPIPGDSFHIFKEEVREINGLSFIIVFKVEIHDYDNDGINTYALTFKNEELKELAMIENSSGGRGTGEISRWVFPNKENELKNGIARVIHTFMDGQGDFLKYEIFRWDQTEYALVSSEKGFLGKELKSLKKIIENGDRNQMNAIAKRIPKFMQKHLVSHNFDYESGCLMDCYYEPPKSKPMCIQKCCATPISLAIDRNNKEMALLLLKMGAVNKQGNQYSYQYSALYKAIQKGWLDVVQLLFKNGARLGIDSLDCGACENQETAFYTAVKYNRPEIVKFLITQDGRENYINYSNAGAKTPLQLAVEKNYNDIVDILTKAGAKKLQRRKEPKIGSFVLIKGGCFEMGNTFDEGILLKSKHQECVDDFYLGAFEVTQGEWKKVMGSNKSRFRFGDDYPVESVNLEDVEKFIERLNKTSDWKYSLPTEAEWEYACREGGNKVRFGNGNSIIDSEEVNFKGSSSKRFYSNLGVYRRKTTPVGKFAPNSLGLFDMSGNVEEFTKDLYSRSNNKRIPRSNTKDHDVRALTNSRGGSWLEGPFQQRCSHRKRVGMDFSPNRRSLTRGFRLVRFNPKLTSAHTSIPIESTKSRSNNQSWYKRYFSSILSNVREILNKLTNRQVKKEISPQIKNVNQKDNLQEKKTIKN